MRHKIKGASPRLVIPLPRRNPHVTGSASNLCVRSSPAEVIGMNLRSDQPAVEQRPEDPERNAILARGDIRARRGQFADALPDFTAAIQAYRNEEAEFEK